MNFMPARLLLCLCLLWLAAVPLFSHATENVLEVQAEQPYTSLVPWLSQYLDSSTILGTEDVQQGNTPFQPVSHKGISLGFVDSALWLRFTLRNSHEQANDLFLEVSYPQLDNIQLYTTSTDIRTTLQQLGDLQPAEQRPINTRLPTFHINLPAGETRTYYLRIQSTSALNVPVNLSGAAALMAQQQRFDLHAGIFYGITIAVMFYNLLILLYLRDRLYLFFLGFAASLAGIMLCMDGIGYQLWSNIGPWEERAITVFDALAGIFGLLFVRDFLQTPLKHPRLDKLYRNVIILDIILLVLTPLLPFKWLVAVINLPALACIPVLFTHAFIRGIRGDRAALIFSAGWIGFFVLANYAVISNMGIAHHMDQSIYYLKYAIEGIMLGLALSIAYRLYQSRTDEMQTKADTEAAMEISRTRNEFLAKMSHELRTPMNGVLGISELLRDTPLSPLQRDYVNTLYDSGRHLLDVINEILDFSKLSADKVRINPEPFSLSRMADDLKNFFHIQAENRKLDFKVELDSEADIMVGDQLWLRQIIINLISNAFKFTAEGKIRVLIRGVRITEHEIKLTVNVVDSGPGIHPDQAKKLFTPFTQIEEPSTRRHGGTGLGLAICKQLVELMNGEIGVDSMPGKGSTFWFSLLLKIQDQRTATAPMLRNEAQHKLDYDSLSGLHVLVAEDNETNRMVILRMLEKFGIFHDSAHDGNEAVEMACKNRSYNLILMDCEMPQISGLEASRLIGTYEQKNSLPHIPIIALTAHTAPELVSECHKAGMDTHLGKPFRQQDLAEIIAAFAVRRDM